ncbi:MAG: YdcH family protein [Nitrospirae bacterium]|nr:YdcH family protein [Nitrospirota bacterium]
MTEQEIIEQLRQQNEQFKQLEEDHRTLDLQIDEIDKKKYLTTEEDIKRKELSKTKLYKKDQIAQMIRDYKRSPN